MEPASPGRAYPCLGPKNGQNGKFQKWSPTLGEGQTDLCGPIWACFDPFSAVFSRFGPFQPSFSWVLRPRWSSTAPPHGCRPSRTRSFCCVWRGSDPGPAPTGDRRAPPEPGRLPRSPVWYPAPSLVRPLATSDVGRRLREEGHWYPLQHLLLQLQGPRVLRM